MIFCTGRFGGKISALRHIVVLAEYAVKVRNAHQDIFHASHALILHIVAARLGHHFDVGILRYGFQESGLSAALS